MKLKLKDFLELDANGLFEVNGGAGNCSSNDSGSGHCSSFGGSCSSGSANVQTISFGGYCSSSSSPSLLVTTSEDIGKMDGMLLSSDNKSYPEKAEVGISSGVVDTVTAVISGNFAPIINGDYTNAITYATPSYDISLNFVQPSSANVEYNYYTPSSTTKLDFNYDFGSSVAQVDYNYNLNDSLAVTGNVSYNVQTATPNFTCGFEVDKTLQASLAIQNYNQIFANIFVSLKF